MAAECATTAVTRMATLLGVSVSGYYKHVNATATTELGASRQRREELAVQIASVHRDSRGVYGSPRITAELRARGTCVTAKTVAKIMVERGLAGISPRTFSPPTTVVDPFATFPPDLVKRVFDRGRIDAVWTSDITYLSCGEGDMYLCVIKDEHSKRALGWAVADHMRADLVTDAVEMAVRTRHGQTEGVIMHSDRGSQYTASVMTRVCEEHGLLRSMGRTGVCWDNAGAESLWSTFKHEHYYRHTYVHKTELVAAVDNWLNYYNTTRRHYTIGMLSPVDYEMSLTADRQAA
ncbi:IS3 family transposase [Gordonia westfalica]|uniref:IS3 family transposase n=1 Tax=Gordonia westfalica TaxID=158898 RepID=A0ABU2GUD7_9ACTN|nr:IS3 family transposase [Gordonia westfalica]MDS1115074.1 IS3 family transposase [Gordonia westfalica]